MPSDYPVQITQTIAPVSKLSRFQQTAFAGEKVFFSDIRQEFIALNNAADRSGEFSMVDDDAGFAVFTTTELYIPDVGDSVQIMSSVSGSYLGTYQVIRKGTGAFTLNVPFGTTTSGYWKREATIVIPSKLLVKIESADYSAGTKRTSTNADINSLIYNTFAGDFQYEVQLDSVFNHQIGTEIVLVSDNNLVVVTIATGGTLVDRRAINQTARLIKVLPNKWLMVNF